MLRIEKKILRMKWNCVQPVIGLIDVGTKLDMAPLVLKVSDQYLLPKGNGQVFVEGFCDLIFYLLYLWGNIMLAKQHYLICAADKLKWECLFPFIHFMQHKRVK